MNGLDFIDRDPDRFNVRVYDPDRFNANVPSISVNISTSNVAGYEGYNDDETEIALVKCADPNWTGWYWSDSQMLVSNTVDDLYFDDTIQQDDSAPEGAINDKGPDYKIPVSDRTHLVALGGTIKATYTVDGVSYNTPPATVKAEKTVKLHVTILRDKAAADGGVAVITPDDVNKDVKDMREIYAQAGIRVLIVDYVNENVAQISSVGNDQVRNPPAGVDFADKEFWISDMDNNKKWKMDQEDNALLGKTNEHFRTPSANNKDDIEIYYVMGLGEPFMVNGVRGLFPLRGVSRVNAS